mgnify:CR=1 FL=1
MTVMAWALALSARSAWADCPERRAEVAGTVTAEGLAEASGLVASGRDPGVLYTHNDSGNAPALYALTTDGRALGTWPVEAPSVDWEDIARHGERLVIGDIGDNRARRDHVTLITVLEPDPRARPSPLEATMRTVRYDDGPRDTEVLLVHPVTGETVLVSKGREGEHAVYVVEGERARRVGVLPYLPATPFRTAGDVAPDGSMIVLRGYTFAWTYAVAAGATLVEALRGVPCPLPLAPEAQGEAIAVAADGSVYTLSEGEAQPLWRYVSTP